MANPRTDEKSTTQRVEDAVHQMGDRTAEQANRISQAAVGVSGKMVQAGAEAGGKLAEAGASLLQQNAETIQNTLRASVDMATSLMGRSTNQFLDQTLGSSGQEAEQITERTARNAEAILYSTSEASKAMSEISREYFDFTRQQVEKSVERLNHLLTCRNPREFAAVHSELMREMMAGFFESSRRMAEMSAKLADNAGKRVNQVERHAA
jgi:phasin family protein